MSALRHQRSFAKIQELESGAVKHALHALESPKFDPGSICPAFTLETATALHNRARNRYTNVLPWDSTRVALVRDVALGPGSDPGPDPDWRSFNNYINASRIHLSGENRYIATQGPLPHTASHFWWMCFMESETQGNDVIVIAMVTPLQESGVTKCFKYWPDIEDGTQELPTDFTSTALTVEQISRVYDEEGRFYHSNFELKYNGKTKTVHHFYYDQWADCKVPPSLEPLLTLSQRINNIKTANRSHPPTPIVHCSAGVGRTGTFIAIDYLISNKGSIVPNEDTVAEVVQTLRSQRMMMVQTIHQYVYLHRAMDSILQ